MTHDLRLKKIESRYNKKNIGSPPPKAPSFTRRSLGEGGKPSSVAPPFFHQTKMRNYNLKNMLQFSYLTLSAHHRNLSYNSRLTTHDLRLTTQKNREHVQQEKHRESSPKSTSFTRRSLGEGGKPSSIAPPIFSLNKDAKS